MPMWGEASDLLAGLEEPTPARTELRVSLSHDELARLRKRADALDIPVEEALRRLI